MQFIFPARISDTLQVVPKLGTNQLRIDQRKNLHNQLNTIEKHLSFFNTSVFFVATGSTFKEVLNDLDDKEKYQIFHTL